MGKLRVLIVDDSKISRVMIAENLRDTDFEVCGMAADAVYWVFASMMMGMAFAMS